jgi:hypothetical protein
LLQDEKSGEDNLEDVNENEEEIKSQSSSTVEESYEDQINYNKYKLRLKYDRKLLNDILNDMYSIGGKYYLTDLELTKKHAYKKVVINASDLTDNTNCLRWVIDIPGSNNNKAKVEIKLKTGFFSKKTIYSSSDSMNNKDFYKFSIDDIKRISKKKKCVVFIQVKGLNTEQIAFINIYASKNMKFPEIARAFKYSYSDFTREYRDEYINRTLSAYTLGDGNCAFNAAALGIIDLIFKDKFPNNNEFYDAIKRSLKLKGDNSNQIKLNFIYWLTQNKNPIIRQKAIQPVLRKMAVKFIEENINASTWKERLWNACKNFHANINDSTFTVHNFIAKKFREIGLTKEKLFKWWDNEGKYLYFKAMSESAKVVSERNKWASEVELEALALCLGINIRLVYNNIDNQFTILGVANGFIPKSDITSAELGLLSKLNIGTEIFNGFHITCKSSDEINKCLSPMSDNERDWIKQILESRNDNDRFAFPDKFDGISEENILILKEKLLARGILNEYNLFINDGEQIERDRIEVKMAGNSDENLAIKVQNAFVQAAPEFSVSQSHEHWSYLTSVNFEVNKQNNQEQKQKESIYLERNKNYQFFRNTIPETITTKDACNQTEQDNNIYQQPQNP